MFVSSYSEGVLVMANCLNCGREIFVGNVAELGIIVGYCECAGVPEVAVFVSGLDFLELSPESQVLADKAEDYEMNKCIGDQAYDWRDMPCCSDVTEVFCDVCGDFGPDACSCLLPVFCVVCDTCTCDGKCDDGKVEIEDEDFVYVYTEAEVLAASVGCASCGQAACQGPNERGYCLEYYDNENLAAIRKSQGLAEDGPEPVAVAPKWVEAAMVLMMIVSFFGILYDIATGRNNDPKLVIAWYAFCAYLIVSYSAVIIWFLC